MKKWLKKTVCKIFFNPKFMGNDEFFDIMDEIDADKKRKEERKIKKIEKNLKEICPLCDKKLHWFEKKCEKFSLTTAEMVKVHVVCSTKRQAEIYNQSENSGKVAILENKK